MNHTEKSTRSIVVTLKGNQLVQASYGVHRRECCPEGVGLLVRGLHNVRDIPAADDLCSYRPMTLTEVNYKHTSKL